MRIDLGALLLALLDSVEVFEDSFEVGLVLVEHFTLYGLSDAVHAVKAHLLIVLVNAKFVEVLDKHPTILDIVVDVLAGLLLVVGEG